MTLHRRTLFVIGLAVCALVGTLQVVFSRLLMDGFLATERLTVTTHVERTYGLIENLATNLSSKISDWARWDDCYEFMKNRNAAFIRSNLTPDAAQGLSLNHFLFFNLKGVPMLAKSYDLIKEEEVTTPPELLEFFKKRPDLLSFTTDDESHHGIISTSYGPVLAVMQPILQSDGTGPTRGTLVFAKIIGESDQALLSKLLQLPVTLHDATSPTLARDLRNSLSHFTNTTTTIIPESEAMSKGYGIVRNLLGSPAILFQIDVPREIYRQAKLTHRSMLGALLITALVFTVLIIVTFKYSVLSRIRALTHQVGAIAKSGDAARHIVLEGKDELSALALDINNMLDSLEQIRKELVNTSLMAQSANQMKSAFVANVSHEIRTPLNGVLGVTQMLEQMRLSPEVRTLISMISDSGNALLSVINDILDFSKIEAGKLTLDPVPTDLPALVSGGLSSLALRAFQKEVELVCDVHPDVPTHLVIDGLRMRQVILNLLSNAIKFTHKGQVTLRITSAPAGEGICTLTVAVTDSGIGIPKHKQDSIFGAFSQADASTTRTYGGTGLGLTISRTLVEMLGGALQVESEEGRGATFFFTVPARICSSHSDTLPALPQEKRSVPVKIVEENSTVALTTQRALMSMGFEEVSIATWQEVARLPPKSEMLVVTATFGNGSGADAHAGASSVLQTHTEIKWVGVIAPHHIATVPELRARGVTTFVHKPLTNHSIQTAALLALGVITEESTGNAGTSAEQFVPRRPLRVLAVDDVKMNQTVARLMLESWGHTVEVASSGIQAIELLEQRGYFSQYHTRGRDDFDIILMDMQMPELDGVATSERIRERERAATSTNGERYSVPILAVTANVLSSDIDRCTLAGMCGAVTKPIEAKKLFGALELLTDALPTLSIDPSNIRSSPGITPPAAGENVPTTRAPITVRLNELGNRETKIIDLQYLIGEFGHDEEMLTEILGAFVEEIPELISNLQRALDASSPEEVARAAHALKGSLGNAGAHQPRALAAQLETLARQGESAALKALGDKLSQETEAARAVLAKALA